MRISVFLWLLLIPVSIHAQSKNSPPADFGPTQVLNTLRQMREQRGDPNPPKLATCLKNSSDTKWSELQAHFYCWLKADQRACFTGAVDGEFKDHPELKGNYDMAFSHCQEAKGRAYGINFDRPMSRFTVEQGEVFKNILYRRPQLPKDEQRKILETFYAGTVPDRKPFPAPVQVATPTPPPAPVASPVPVAPPAPPVSPPVMASAATMANPDIGDEDETPAKVKGYPRSCQIKSPHARTRQKPDSTSPVVAILDPATVQITGPAQASTGTDAMKWYPIEFHHKGKLVNAYLSVSLVDCSK